MRAKLKKTKKELERGALHATQWIGSTASIIVHTVIFIVAFSLPFLGVALDRVLLILTTAVSLEAIYLAIFIQMSVNKNTADIEEIQEDVEEIQEDVDEIQKDVDEIQEDVDEIQEDIEEEQEKREDHTEKTLIAIQKTLATLHADIEQLRKK